MRLLAGILSGCDARYSKQTSQAKERVIFTGKRELVTLHHGALHIATRVPNETLPKL